MEFDEIKLIIEKLLKPKRFTHTLNVVKEAKKLSEVYGADKQKAALAALLHDCAKCFKNDELISLAKKYKYKIDIIQNESPELLHGPIGAIYTRENFGITDVDILNSIEYHTTGRPNMSLLEKIIYIADLIEEGRDFPELLIIRKLSYKNLNEAIIYSCNNTIQYVLKKNFLLHPLTIELRNSLLIGGLHTDEKTK